MAGHAAYMGKMKYRQKILVPKWDRMDLEDNSINMDIKKTVFEDAD